MADTNRIWIPHSRPTLGEAEVEAAADVIRSGQIAYGEVSAAFERDLACQCRRQTAAVVGSGTAGLFLSLRVLGIGSDHEVIIPSYVCSALVNAVRLAGAQPVVADVDPITGNIDPDDVRRRLTKRTGAIIVVHLFGRPAPVEPIIAYGAPVIEDCAQAIGARIGNRPVGSFGKLAVFSFYATKVITSGEGGGVAGDRELIQRVADLRDYDNKDTDAFRFNFKMSELQAAVGRSQLQRIDTFIDRRRELARFYGRRLTGAAVMLPAPWRGGIAYRFVIGAHHGVEDWARSLHAMGVGVARPVHRPLHRLLGQEPRPGAEAAWKDHLSLPIYPSLSEAQAAHIADSVLALASNG